MTGPWQCERQIYMRKYKHRPEEETSLPEELLMKVLFFIFCFSAPSLISLEVFYEAVVHGQGTGKRVQ